MNNGIWPILNTMQTNDVLAVFWTYIEYTGIYVAKE